eukprot:TRINITY_DN9989_c0_g2_i5.p3 TRINITY_DN9989_c0_g2~~TRINITY_DN9989_c0_g2_i5.p3  ORF type:complete len:133 (+),score=20.03 TRINITY_DN9989_c0_g2_i5:1225-1623(+)
MQRLTRTHYVALLRYHEARLIIRSQQQALMRDMELLDVDRMHLAQRLIELSRSSPDVSEASAKLEKQVQSNDLIQRGIQSVLATVPAASSSSEQGRILDVFSKLCNRTPLTCTDKFTDKVKLMVGTNCDWAE